MNNLSKYTTEVIVWIIDQHKLCLFITLFAHIIYVDFSIVLSIYFVELALNIKALRNGIGHWKTCIGK
jgi:hypothetical protein